MLGAPQASLLSGGPPPGLTHSGHSSCPLGLQPPVRLCFLSHTEAHAEPSSESSANRRVSRRLSGDLHRIHRRARRPLPRAELLCAAGDTWSETVSSGASRAESSSTSSPTRILCPDFIAAGCFSLSQRYS